MSILLLTLLGKCCGDGSKPRIGDLVTRLIKTSVCIVGSGPSGLLLSQLLANAGVDSVVLDRKDRAHIESRVRAGVLEQGTVDALEEAGGAERLHREALPHEGFELSFDGHRHRIDLAGLTGQSVTVYGQTEVTKDLFAKRVDDGQIFLFQVSNVKPADLTTDAPKVHCEHNGILVTIECDFVAGCDGSHGACRQAIPSDVLRTFERVYPFGWLGVLVEKPPVSEELIYANHSEVIASVIGPMIVFGKHFRNVSVVKPRLNSRQVHPLRKASRPCDLSWPSLCATVICSLPVMRRILFHRLGRRGLIWPLPILASWRAL